MASSNTNSTSQVRVVLAPRDHTILGHLLLQPVFALTIFGGALGLRQKLDSAKLLLPRRGGSGGSGGSGGHSGGSRSRGSGGEGEVVVYYPLIISACFLLYNLVMIYGYLKNKMNLLDAIQMNIIFWIAFLFSAVITGVWAPQYASFGSPPLAASFLGAIFLVIVLMVSTWYLWKVRKSVLAQEQSAPAPIPTSQNPGA